MLTLTTDSSDFRKHCPEYEAWHSRHEPAYRTFAATAASSYAYAGCGSYAYSESPSSLSLSSSPSTGGGTRLGSQIGCRSPSSGQSSHHGSQCELEVEFEEGSTERMESLVSGLLQDDGRDFHASAVVRPAVADVLDNSSSSYDSLFEVARRIQELQIMQHHQDHYSNGSSVGPRDERSCDTERLNAVSNNMIFDGRPLPPTEILSPYGESNSFEESLNHQMLANEVAVRESFLQASLSANGPNNVNLSYFSNSEQSGVGSTNSNVHMTLPTQDHAYVQRELNDMAIRNHEYAGEMQVIKNKEMMRMLSARAEYAAEYAAELELLTDRETLRKQERLVSDLHMIAESLAQSAIVERYSAERTNGALVAFCKWLYERGCATSDAELEKVKRGIRDASQLRGHDQSLHSRQCYAAAGHSTTGQPSFGTNFSSPRPLAKAMNNSSASSTSSSSTYFNSSVSEAVRSAAPPSSGQTVQPTPYVRSRSFRNTPERKLAGHQLHSATPLQRTSSTRNTRASRAAVHATRAAENDLQLKFTTGLHPRTPTRVSAFPNASTPIKRAGNLNAMAMTSISGINSDLNRSVDSFQMSFSEQQPADRNTIAVQQSTGSASGRSTPLRRQDSPATKALIAQGAKSISILLKSENSAPCGRKSYPASPCNDNQATAVSADSGSPSPIRRRRLDMSDIDEDASLQLIPIQNPTVELDVCNQGQFKTELCNNWQETHFCPYGEHCRFAHGVEELRCVLRHPRYKTIPCRMIMNGKACIYGHRCHFRHSLTTEELSLISIIDVHDVPAVHKRAMKTVVS